MVYDQINGDNMKAFFIVPGKCPIEDIARLLREFENIREEIFLNIFDNFTPADIFNERKINEKYYAVWMCAGCTKAIGPDHCEFSKCKLGGGPYE